MYPGRWEDIVGRNRRGSLGSGVEVGRRGFVDRKLGWKDSRDHNSRPLEEGRRMGCEGRNFVGRVGRRNRIALRGTVVGAGNSLGFEGIVIDLGSADRTAKHYD